MDEGQIRGAFEHAYAAGFAAFVKAVAERDPNVPLPLPIVRIAREAAGRFQMHEVFEGLAQVGSGLDLVEPPSSAALGRMRAHVNARIAELHDFVADVDLQPYRRAHTRRPNAVFDVLDVAHARLERAADEVGEWPVVDAEHVIRLHSVAGAYDAAATVAANRLDRSAHAVRPALDAVTQAFISLEHSNDRVMAIMSDSDLEVARELLGEPLKVRSATAAYGLASVADRQGARWLDDLFVAERQRIGRNGMSPSPAASDDAKRWATRVLAVEATGRHLPPSRPFHIVR
ncbi:MAG: hypothetical protein ACOYNI_10890 [Acidimicrobiia bacterium]